MVNKLFVGPYIHSLSLSDLSVVTLGAIGVSSGGKILFAEQAPLHSHEAWISELKLKWDLTDELVLGENQFLIPGFIDTHTHAPQYVNSGLGLDLPLLDWLEKYTFPREQEFADTTTADKVYPACIRRHLVFGSTTCCYYGTIHLESNKRLVDHIERIGQRGIVGKVNMDRNSPEYLTEDTEQSIKDTEEFIKYVQAKQNSTIIPCVTPRFAPSCTPELLKALGRIAEKYKVPIQSHLSENVAECEWVKELFPGVKDYSRVYDQFGLLNDNTIMAHCIYLDESEVELLKERGTGVSHCPNSNFGISSGICPVKKYLKAGLKVGLGTDVSGGHHPSMLDAMKSAILASKVLALPPNKKNEEALTVAEAFYLATLGSASICGLENVVGNFLPGKEFDAVLVDVKQLYQLVGEDVQAHHHTHALQKHHEHLANNIDLWAHDDLASTFERFVYLGDDRNISKVWVKGKVVKS